MLKITLKVLGVLGLVLLAFVIWVSPGLGGLIPTGKVSIDKTILVLHFDSTSIANFKLEYWDISTRTDLVELRRACRLDSLVQDCRTGFEKISKIQSWVQSRWVRVGENLPEFSNAMYIPKETEKGNHIRCVEYCGSESVLGGAGFQSKNIRTDEPGYC